MEKHLHIVTHEIPWPADYGGVMDLYHKIEALHAEGIRIHLHCFSRGKTDTGPLNELCESVDLYERKLVPSVFHWNLPYIVSSRVSGRLYRNLKKDNHPVLLEGIHCAFLLYKNKLADRKVFLRLHNVEHVYYRELKKNERNLFRKLYFGNESRLLRRFENIVAAKSTVLCVSEQDKRLYSVLFNAKDTHFLPVFTGYRLTAAAGKGNFCLYHGNLGISENSRAALWLLNKVFYRLTMSLVVAGRNPSDYLRERLNEHPYGSIVADPSDKDMDLLISQAQVNLIPSFNKTGVKLKLIHALFEGRFCVVNKEAVLGSGLEKLVTIADDYRDFREKISDLFEQEFTSEMLAERSRVLGELYDNKKNVLRLIQWIY